MHNNWFAKIVFSESNILLKKTMKLENGNVKKRVVVNLDGRFYGYKVVLVSTCVKCSIMCQIIFGYLFLFTGTSKTVSAEWYPFMAIVVLSMLTVNEILHS